MSDIIQAVKSILAADGGVSAITTRIISDHLPQSMNTPAVVMWTVSSVAVDYLAGFTGFEQSILQVECYADTRAQSAALWKAVNEALRGYRGTAAGVPVRSVSQSSGHYDREDPPEAGSDRYRYVTVQDFEFSYHSYEV